MHWRPGTVLKISLNREGCEPSQGTEWAGLKDVSSTPWQKGRSLAGELRRSFGFGSRPLSDKDIAETLRIPERSLQSSPAAESRPPLGLAIRSVDTGQLKLLFRKRNRPGLRFEASRFLADQFLAPAGESWLPVTDTGTARQKIQRAFAAEFLSPIDSLDEYLNGDYSPEAIEVAGEYFGVSELAITSHLANHGRLPFGAARI